MEALSSTFISAQESPDLTLVWLLITACAWLYVAFTDFRTHEVSWASAVALLSLSAGSILFGANELSLHGSLSVALGGAVGLIAYFCILGLGTEFVNDRIIGRADRELLIAAGATCGISDFLPILLPTMTIYIVACAAISRLHKRRTQPPKTCNIALAPGFAATVLIHITGLSKIFFA